VPEAFCYLLSISARLPPPFGRSRCPPWTPGYSARPPIAAGAWYNHLGGRRGAGKNKIDGPPRTFALQKVHVGKEIKKIDKNFDVSFSSTFLVLSRFRVFFSDGSSKTLQKTFYKKIVSNSFYKNFDQKSKPTFSRILFNHVFERFSMRGVKKHDKKISKNKSDPSPFSYSDPPTHHGGHRFFFCRPLGGRLAVLGAWLAGLNSVKFCLI
jgi:hypothetical protein